ncbi:MAG: ankyrin repeat domain-containing protein [Candidatus Latescibacteria bacterium]|nr:ankyrin repeat domain-containing protein [Candidatus Latescibacterota bacterium]
MVDIKFPGKASDFLKVATAAAARGDLTAVDSILDARPQWLSRTGSHGRTMLWEAAHRGKLAMVEYLAARGADINACGTHYTPYFVEVSCYCIARYKKRDDVADFLLAQGAKTDLHTMAFLGDRQGAEDWLKRQPESLYEGHPQHTMGAMEESGLDFYLAPAPWATPLCYALRGGDAETVELLIGQGAKIKGYEDDFFIAANNDLDKIRHLLEHGADPGKLPPIPPDAGELFALASSYGAKTPDTDTYSAELVYLCRGDRGGNPAEVKRLLGLGADIDFQDNKGKTALHRAAKAGFVKTIGTLLDYGACADIADTNGETALFEVVHSTIKNDEKRKSAAHLLLKAGADPLRAARKGKTPLSAAKSAKGPVVEQLAEIMLQSIA